MKEFRITPERRTLFNGTVLLDYMVGRKEKFDVLLPGSTANLESILTWLMTREAVEISSRNFYEVTAKGKSIVADFKDRYQKILQYFDVFAAVDLASGDFALSHIGEFESEATWQRFLDDERWEDLRVPVATSLGADPVEFVFAHFMREGRFDFQQGGWEITLLEGMVWGEIEQICWSSLEPADLAYDDVSGDEVLAEVVEQGFLLVRSLSDHDPELMGHLARWAPSRKAPDYPPDDSAVPFWKTRWTLDLV